MGTLKSNHAFTKQQLEILNQELQKISTDKIVALRSPKVQAKENYIDIEVLHTPYMLDVFLSFVDITDAEYPKFMMYKIDSKGSIDYEPRKNMNFETLSDRIHFFNTLQPIKFNK